MGEAYPRFGSPDLMRAARLARTSWSRLSRASAQGSLRAPALGTSPDLAHGPGTLIALLVFFFPSLHGLASVRRLTFTHGAHHAIAPALDPIGRYLLAAPRRPKSRPLP